MSARADLSAAAVQLVNSEADTQDEADEQLRLADALRALADRLDVEMRAVLSMEQETRDTNDADGWGCAATIAQTLTRLDADLAPAIQKEPR